MPRYLANDAPAPTAPQPQTVPEPKAPKEVDKKPEQAIDADENSEPNKEGQPAKNETDTPAAEKTVNEKEKKDAKKAEDAGKKKAQEDAAKKAEEDAAKKANEEAKANMKAESKRQEDFKNHLIKRLYMLTQAEVQFLKDKPEFGKVGKLIYIPALYCSSVEVLLVEVCRIVMAQCNIENVSYTINDQSGRISFEWKKATLLFLSLEKYFFNQLGLATQQVERFSKPLYYAPSKIWGDDRASWDDVKTLFI